MTIQCQNEIWGSHGPLVVPAETGRFSIICYGSAAERLTLIATWEQSLEPFTWFNFLSNALYPRNICLTNRSSKVLNRGGACLSVVHKCAELELHIDKQ